MWANALAFRGAHIAPKFITHEKLYNFAHTFSGCQCHSLPKKVTTEESQHCLNEAAFAPRASDNANLRVECGGATFDQWTASSSTRLQGSVSMVSTVGSVVASTMDSAAGSS